jgi:hypothetical protein
MTDTTRKTRTITAYTGSVTGTLADAQPVTLRVGMTVKQLVDAARHPDRFTTEQIREAFHYWSEKATASPLGQGAEYLERAVMCTEALRARRTAH